jgi:hypothetical protein
MTLSAVVVLAAGLAAASTGAPIPAQKHGSAAPTGATRDRSRPDVTCSLRIVHAPDAIDAGMLAPTPARLGSVQGYDDAIVRDSVSPCAGATTRRAAGSGGAQR